MTTTPPAFDASRHALFLDFDGTLAPIVDTPEQAAMSDRTHEALVHAIERCHGAVALVSGRALHDLARRLPSDLDVALSGSHGHEIRWPGEDVTDPTPAEPLAAVEKGLASFSHRHNLRMERKPGALTLHYRGMPHLEEVVRDTVRMAAEGHPGLADMHGNMVSEVVLSETDKGTAIGAFLKRPPFRGRLPIMVGDDVTDERGFQAAAALGGFGIKIGKGDTVAEFRLADIDALTIWLSNSAAVPNSRV